MHEKKFLGEKMHEVVHPKSESKHPQSTVLLTLSCPPLNDRCACEFIKMVSLPREAASCCPFLFFSSVERLLSILSSQSKLNDSLSQYILMFLMILITLAK